MLVLTRKLGEAIVVPDSHVTITVVAIHGKRVRLGIVAPSQVAVHRLEVWDQLQVSAPSTVPPVASDT